MRERKELDIDFSLKEYSGCLGLVHWDDRERWCGGAVGGGSGLGICVHPWWIHVDVLQNQCNIVK